MRTMFSIDYPDGRRLTRVVDADQFTDADLDTVAECIEPYLQAAMAEMGWDRELAMIHLAMVVIEDEADQAAYQRVCERKGLLPL